MSDTKDQLTYGSYLQVDALLSLQREQSDPPQHDELLFIIVHQAYELWFLQLLHEIEATIRHLDANALLRVAKNFRRIHAIGRLMVSQFDVLETMTPIEFNSFRDRLNPASGFQSAQFREIEFLCGIGKSASLRHFEPTPAERERLELRLQQPTLYDALKGLLARRGFLVGNTQELIESFKTIYNGIPDRDEDLYLLLEDFIEFDEQLLLWRNRHVLMVERMIGMKPGTGGSLGVSYLQKTLVKRLFPELWTVRTELGETASAQTEL